MGWFGWLFGILYSYTLKPSMYILCFGGIWYYSWRKINMAIASHLRHPTGYFGRTVAPSLMNLMDKSGVKWFLEQVVIERGEKILDVGCGSGNAIEPILERFKELAPNGDLARSKNVIDAVDHSSEIMEYCSEHFHEAAATNVLRFHQLDVTQQLPFQDEAYDMVLVFNILHFFKDPVPALKEFCRCLKPGGRLLIGMKDSERYIREPEVQAGILQQIYHIVSVQQTVAQVKGFSCMQSVTSLPKPVVSEDEVAFVLILCVKR